MKYSYRQVMQASWNALELQENLPEPTSEGLDSLLKALLILRKMQDAEPFGLDEVNDFEECLEDLF